MCSHPGPGNLCPLKSVPRSEEKAIHFPSGDQEGLKNPCNLPAGASKPPVRLRAFRVLISRIQILFDPPPREEMNASWLPSGESVAWSSNPALSVSRSTPE